MIAVLLAGAGLVLAPLAHALGDEPQPDTAVRLSTDQGDVVIGIFAGKAPASSKAFLAEVQSGDYDGGVFFRTVRKDNDNSAPNIEVVQATVSEAAGAKQRDPVEHEDTARTGLRHVDGAVSLPRAAIGTTTAASFFISIGDQPALDFGGKRNPDGQGFAVFGRVICGMDVVRKIHEEPAAGESPSPVMKGQVLTKPVVIKSMRVVDPVCTANSASPDTD